MLTIPRRYDNRLPLTAIASLLVLINASLIGLDFYQRNNSSSAGIFTASSTAPADNGDKSQGQASTPTEEKSSEQKTEQPEGSNQNTPSPSGEPVQVAPDHTSQSDTPVVVNSSPAQSEPTFEPGRGGGSPPHSSEPTAPSQSTPSQSTSTSPTATESSPDTDLLDTEKTLNSTTSQVNPLLQQADE